MATGQSFNKVFRKVVSRYAIKWTNALNKNINIAIITVVKIIGISSKNINSTDNAITAIENLNH